jgi:glucose/arabinose dehydrogenase
MKAALTLCSMGLAVLSLAGCYNMRPSSGGGQTEAAAVRRINPADVAVAAGYRIEPVASGLTFPTSVTFDDAGVPHVIEAGYSYGEVFTTPRLLRVEQNGSLTEVARGTKNGPWTGVVYARGAFYVAEGGQLEGGRILRIAKDGTITALVEKLPGNGDHHTNGPAIGPDGLLYFTQGTATNSAVVGEDNLKFGWLKRFPKFHDIPCQDITLAGRNFESPDVLGGSQSKVQTGAFVPFGTATHSGEVIKGEVPCSGSVMRLPLAGGKPELVAWGFRNPFGIAFAPDGQLYVTENGYDDRGSRPVWGTGDVLWRVTPGTWYGWPDYAHGLPLTLPSFKPPLKDQPQFVFAQHPGKPPRPVAVLGVHASSNGLDFSRSATFGFVGRAFIAEFGDQAPTTGKVLHPVGFRVIQVDVSNGRIEDFAVNRSDTNGPASRIGSAGLERPVSVRFDPSGNALYVVDFGIMLMDKTGPKPQERTGVLWRITRGGPR